MSNPRLAIQSVVLACLVVLQGCAVTPGEPAALTSPVPTPSPAPLDISLCQGVACWHELPLQQLDLDEIQARVRRGAGFENAHLARAWAQSNLTTYSWDAPQPGPEIIVTFRHDKPLVLKQSCDITLQRAIETFGQPSQVVVRDIKAPDAYLAAVVVIYGPLGLVFASDLLPIRDPGYDEKLRISGDMKLLQCTLGPSSGVPPLVEAMLLAQPFAPRETLNRLRDQYVKYAQDWKGYGIYRVDIP
jgi:hypothetical protein